MNIKTKNDILRSIHRLYTTEKSNLPQQIDDDLDFKARLIKAFEDASGDDAPVERNVHILLSDLRGFTAISEDFTPLELIDLLNRYFSVMTKVIDKYNGTIDKLMGDAIMVVFGSPKPESDDLQRTLACAIEMQQELERFNQENELLGYPPLYMGIGINTGQVVAGKLGSEIYNEHTVIGDHVNLASRIESYSSRGQILLSEYTYSFAKDFIETGAINEIELKGIERPIKLYELVATELPRYLRIPKKEIRKSPRIDVNMPIKFRILRGKSKSMEQYLGEILDLSYGGMYVASDAQLPIYAELCFPFSLSLSSNLCKDVYAKVVRVNPCDRRYRYHLEFSSIPQDAEKALKTFIDRIVVGT